MRSRYSRYRRRAAAGANATGHTTFGSTGWLFADLLLALALAFLLATTFGATPPPATAAKPPHPSASATAKPTTSPRPAGQPEPALDLNYVKVPLDIGSGDISASYIEGVITTDSQLKGRQAGLVLIFTGGDANGPQWEATDAQVWSILQGMDHSTPLFKAAVSRPFWNGKLGVTEVMLNVYLFKQKS
jgi:hypothetical protein